MATGLALALVACSSTSELSRTVGCLGCADAAPDVAAPRADASVSRPDPSLPDVLVPQPSDAGSSIDAGKDASHEVPGTPDAAPDARAADAAPEDAGRMLEPLGNAEVEDGAVPYEPDGVLWRAVRLTATSDVDVIYFATLASASGGSVRMALYASSNDDIELDVPTTLLARSGDMPSKAGVTRGAPETSIRLTAGKSYWVALVQTPGVPEPPHLYQQLNTSAVVWTSQSDGFPETFEAFFENHGPGFNFFLFVSPTRG